MRDKALLIYFLLEAPPCSICEVLKKVALKFKTDIRSIYKYKQPDMYLVQTKAFLKRASWRPFSFFSLMKCMWFRLWGNRLDGILLIPCLRLQGVTRPLSCTHPVRLDAQLVEGLLWRGKEKQQMLVNLNHELQLCVSSTLPTAACVGEALEEESMRQLNVGSPSVNHQVW